MLSGTILNTVHEVYCTACPQAMSLSRVLLKNICSEYCVWNIFQISSLIVPKSFQMRGSHRGLSYFDNHFMNRNPNHDQKSLSSKNLITLTPVCEVFKWKHD